MMAVQSVMCNIAHLRMLL